MIATLFLCVRVFLAFLHSLVRWRVGKLEEAHAAQVKLFEAFSKGDDKPNPNHLGAARHYVGLLNAATAVEKAESRYVSRQALCERLERWRVALAGWKPRSVWYVVGKLDVVPAALAAEYAGWGPSWVLAHGMEAVQAWL